jgi:hypothetical protein
MSKEMREQINKIKKFGEILNESVELKSFYTPLYGREEKLLVNKREGMVDLTIISGEEKLKITVNLEDLKEILM